MSDETKTLFERIKNAPLRFDEQVEEERAGLVLKGLMEWLGTQSIGGLEAPQFHWPVEYKDVNLDDRMARVIVIQPGAVNFLKLFPDLPQRTVEQALQYLFEDQVLLSLDPITVFMTEAEEFLATLGL